MMIRCAVCCAVLLAFTTSVWSAAKPAAENTAKTARKPVPKSLSKPIAKAPRKALAKPVAKAPPKTIPKAVAKAPAKTLPKAVAKAPRKPLSKPAVRTAQKPGSLAQKAIHKTALHRSPAPVHAPGPVLLGKTETLTCRDGTEDRHARIGLVLVGGRADSFAYYSKWKPRTCSIYLRRHHDPYSKWTDQGHVTNVSLERGLFLIEHGKGEYRFIFRDIDRERFCGMDGTINGTLTVRKGSERCEVTGIMEEGVPLGQAYAYLEQPAAPAAAPVSVLEPAPVREAAQPIRRSPESVFPRSAD